MNQVLYELAWIACRPFFYVSMFLTIFRATWRCGIRRAEETILSELDFSPDDLDAEEVEP